MAKKKPKKVLRPVVSKKTVAKKKASKKAVKKASKPVAPKKAAAKKAVKKVASITPAARKAAAKKATKKAAVKKRSSKKDEECFLTTACVGYYALADDAYELTTLRAFRDQYMLKSHAGKALVKDYYRIAPSLVSMIKKDKGHRTVYRYIYQCIQKACSEIEEKKYAVAQQTYTSLVTHLSKKYSIHS